MAKGSHKCVTGKWHKRGLIAACLVAGLLIGFGAGYLGQRELKQRGRSTAASKSGESTGKDRTATDSNRNSSPSRESSPEESDSSATVPAHTAPVPPGPVASTPAQAMREYLRSKGMDGTNMYFAVVAQSKVDPNWKLDRGSKANSAATYFILHRVQGGWTVIASGPDFTAEEIRSVGAPSDLPPVG